MSARLLGLSALRSSSPWRIKAHSHPFFEMVMIRRGEQSVVTDGEERHAGSGDVLLFRPNMVHREWSSSDAAKEIFCMSFEWQDAPDDTPLVNHDEKGRIRVLFEWLVAENRTRTTITEEVTQSLLDTLLAHYMQLSMNIEEGFVETVREYMRSSMAYHISLDDLASVAGISKYHFLRKYRKVTGRTPMEDLRIMRLERARELIMTTSEPLKTIPQRVGLDNVYHMTRLFRRHMDVTPGSLRRAASSG